MVNNCVMCGNKYGGVYIIGATNKYKVCSDCLRIYGKDRKDFIKQFEYKCSYTKYLRGKLQQEIDDRLKIGGKDQ